MTKKSNAEYQRAYRARKAVEDPAGLAKQFKQNVLRNRKTSALKRANHWQKLAREINIYLPPATIQYLANHYGLHRVNPKEGGLLTNEDMEKQRGC